MKIKRLIKYWLLPELGIYHEHKGYSNEKVHDKDDG